MATPFIQGVLASRQLREDRQRKKKQKQGFESLAKAYLKTQEANVDADDPNSAPDPRLVNLVNRIEAGDATFKELQQWDSDEAAKRFVKSQEGQATLAGLDMISKELGVKTQGLNFLTNIFGAVIKGVGLKQLKEHVPEEHHDALERLSIEAEETRKLERRQAVATTETAESGAKTAKVGAEVAEGTKEDTIKSSKLAIQGQESANKRLKLQIKALEDKKPDETTPGEVETLTATFFKNHGHWIERGSAEFTDRKWGFGKGTPQNVINMYNDLERLYANVLGGELGVDAGRYIAPSGLSELDEQFDLRES